MALPRRLPLFPNPRRTLKTLKALLLDPLLRRLLLLFRSSMASADALEPNRDDDRRPWDPPFDPSEPSLPISYPIADLRALESRSYFESFHFPFNRASVPLPPSSAAAAAVAAPLPPRRRILVCHDMKGGYRDDAWVQGGSNADAYAIWHWHLMDVFVYFSHYLVTLPPPCWTNAAHTHGVKVLGTFLAEWDAGKVVCETLLATKSAARMYAERLAELASALGFDGWLINLEVNLDSQLIDNLKEFLHHLTETMHSYVPGSLVIWYDAVTKDGQLDWQDQLNGKNKPFFDLCDGIFVNYTWNEKYPEYSAAVAGERKFDVYMGIDVFGRNTFGGGQWNTNVALDLLKKEDISAAIFAPGWVYETKQEPDFQSAQNRWWGLVEQSWGILQTYPKLLPFYSNFDQGHGYYVSVEGVQVADYPWTNISCQGFQPALNYFVDPTQTSMQAFVNFKDAPYSGGGSITVKGNIQQSTLFSTRLFVAKLPLEDLPIYISYSVKSDRDSILALCLELSSETDGVMYALITNDVDSFPSLDPSKSQYYKIIQAEKMESPGITSWILYKATLRLGGYTLTGINATCILRRLNPTKPASRKSLGFGYPEGISDESFPYCASIGHISIRNSEQSMQFPQANAWVTEGQCISWAPDSNGTRNVSLKIVWKLADAYTDSFMKYNIYVEKQMANSGGNSVERTYLGVARVEAFYVSDLDVPSEVTCLRFIIQICAYDGSCQEIEKSPTFILDC
ncbi:Cytosolic endo-beta-N-acetylglucosaminidase 2 [Ananas comosus]|uniref:mannosyl-glycoprotein endo-beta-N-acetylglucosaminidase n=1 Tax=Ananas comosus TaxID=4615 RepID=A0A199V953_ANACO|nr:Cytosolic endo-beta-N-acetylglucosaminidase 2 [Ananas comosus]